MHRGFKLPIACADQEFRGGPETFIGEIFVAIGAGGNGGLKGLVKDILIVNAIRVMLCPMPCGDSRFPAGIGEPGQPIGKFVQDAGCLGCNGGEV